MVVRARLRGKAMRVGALGAVVALGALLEGTAHADPPTVGRATAPAQPRTADGRQVRTIQIALYPENARVAVDGQLKEHPNGILELKGPLGAVFTIEAMSNGARIVERVAVTEIGALPSLIAVPQAPPGFSTTAMGDCAFPFYYDAKGVKHYRTACFPADPEPAPPSAGAPPFLSTSPAASPMQGRATITIVCSPKCDSVADNGVLLGPSNILNRPVLAGRHVLELSAPNGVRKTVTTDVTPDSAKEIRVSMEPEPAAPPAPPPTVGPSSANPAGANEPGFLSIAAYPWASVSEGPRQLCVTPCVKMALAPGGHTLVLENAELGMRRAVFVTIKSGETTAKSVALE
ncbi:MAG: hypothetical protein JST00_32130 [Deltaproteobacteria bacterium]|nr:hypothetical protein [Deltaproteobacteria bacterium]